MKKIKQILKRIIGENILNIYRNIYFFFLHLVRDIFSFLKNPLYNINLKINKLGNKRRCYICKTTFNTFTKYKGGFKNVSDFRLMLDTVGSDIDNFGCMYCGSNDRERHLFMYFDKLDIWSKMNQGAILHFAPEKNLSEKIISLNPKKYIKADLYPAYENIQKIDLTNISFEDNSFDVLIANHILEHIPDFKKALSEIYRVLNTNGIAILQTPYSKLLQKNFCDNGINTKELRRYFYGQEDHVRYFSENELFQSFEEVGFRLNIIKHDSLFDTNSAEYYGTNSKEDFIQIIKSNS